MLEAFLGLSLEEFDEYLRSSNLKLPLLEEVKYSCLPIFGLSTLDTVHTLDQELNFKTWDLGCKPGKTGFAFESFIWLIFFLSFSHSFLFPLRYMLVISFSWEF